MLDGTKATDLTGRVPAGGPRSGGGSGRLGLSERDSGQAAARWSRLLCFGALGASEVTLAGRKLVGISERRDRAGAWFFSMALLEVQARDLAELLAEADLRDPARRRLGECSTAVPGGPSSRDELVAALKLRLGTQG